MQLAKLAATFVKTVKTPGRYGDGDGLFLLVGRSGGKSWIVRVQKEGRRRDIGLGSAGKVSLKVARERAALVRSQVEAGIDPVAERRKAAGIPTFRQAAALVHAEQKTGWKNGKHQAQWLSTLEAYAFPAFGELSVAAVGTAEVRDALVPIWLSKPETARRLRQRIRTVIDWAVAKNYREHSLSMSVIDKALPKQRGKVKHHAALPFADMPAFFRKLRERETMGRLALEAVILTAARSGEVRLARWSEIDLAAGLWTVPAGRMKAGREHVVPLAPAAVALFERMKPYRQLNSELVFPGTMRGKDGAKPLSDMTLLKVLRDMGLKDTVHGLRSTFRDWVSEATQFSSELAEFAIAHAVKGKSVAAYQRGTQLEKRRELMEAWASYCTGDSASKVVKLAVAGGQRVS